ncbi:MAG: aspartyl/asparaginyl beta-hydroxylase domain-containing protein [Sphingosinicella sp.]|uniref:aspartyl/asparaginyl beta-hydroxylase domain-containing protein n=1 Tax=Sphingosinicella sp. TaxID=1917971 RepID=UPI004037AD8B
MTSALPDRIRLPLDFDAGALAADLAAFGEQDWTRHFVRDNYEGAWAALPLRAAVGETHPTRMIGVLLFEHEFADTQLLDRAPAIRAALGRFRCPLKSARLMRLGAGARIREHVDPELDAGEGRARLHVPLTTNLDVTFLLAGTRIEMTPGSTWYLRLTEPHAVSNDGAGDRVHLVIDAVVDDWLGGMLRAAA